ncbi:hypothetical protein PSE_5006 [Pseudovibrio sp. FO-BEG1]|nr:hypothetical protein PSE_5006 [Pseudovibrio sp. FO-BEG1]
MIAFAIERLTGEVLSIDLSFREIITVGAIGLFAPTLVASLSVVTLTIKWRNIALSQNQMFYLAAFSVIIDLLFYWAISILLYSNSVDFSDVIAHWGVRESTEKFALFAILMFFFSMFVSLLLRWLALRISTWLVLKFVQVEEAESTS